ncbi:LPXTG-motif cell wall anchor domain-containing protein [Streptomyces sp. TLI_053]|uniref:LAETG motif-containing sortase-dependent surface protein n=1 Tax=Streptomyces sp. TLI_053 TaxID=1855352 RepID=UPI00087B666C|nr:LAETG motif-containing sortase-dependent surface protein [Streptomyces sp. TLI_053]SDT71576.1 LPXTG-motif cell wall anchor domain-containing protein [Streptomyces sp. TLI_053]
MRTSRLLAASTLIALSLGATVGTATAGAVGISPTPTTTAPTSPAPTTAAPTTAPSGSPSATPTPTGTPSTGTPSASTSPSATGTPGSTTSPKPTNRPTPPAPTFTNRCQGGVHGGDNHNLKATGTGLWGTTLVKGGPAQEVQVTFENTTGVDLARFSSSIYITDNWNERPLDWRTDFFTVQLRLPGSDWKPAELVDRAIDTGTHRIAKGEKLTIQFRIAANAAPVGDYGGTVGGGSEVFDNTPDLPQPASPLPNSCTQYGNYYEGGFKVADKSSTTATTPLKATASPSAVSGPHLADTGSSSNTLPIAVGGAAVLAAGAGTLLVLRRRKAGAHS